uniref:Uncharacterized protein n=1 Tax=Anguilla anguilla TaxID=7936 RepID=A0A0E9UM76_ANGAN
MAGSFPLHTEKGQASVFKLPSKKTTEALNLIFSLQREVKI